MSPSLWNKLLIINYHIFYYFLIFYRYADTKFKDIPEGFEVLDELTHTPSSEGRSKQNYCTDDSVRVRNLLISSYFLTAYQPVRPG